MGTAECPRASVPSFPPCGFRHAHHETRRCDSSSGDLLSLTLVSGFSSLARAQAPAPPPPEREGSAEFAFVGTTGNSSTQTIGLGGEFIYRPVPWESKL